MKMTIMLLSVLIFCASSCTSEKIFTCYCVDNTGVYTSPMVSATGRTDAAMKCNKKTNATTSCSLQ